MIQAFNIRSLYMQVRDSLARRIAAEEFKVGAALPNEFLLSQQMGVSLGTVRKAIDVLVTEKILTRHPGRGTFVASRLSEEVHNKLDRIRHLDGSFVTWQFLESQVTRGDASEVEREKLGLDVDARVVRVSRLRGLNGKPYTKENTALPEVRFPVEGTLSARDGTIVALAYAHRVMLGACEEGAEIILADASQAVLFGVDFGAPLLKLDRIVFDVDGKPVEWRISICHLKGLKYLSRSS